MQAVFVSLKTASKKCLSFCFLSKHYMTFHFKSKVEIPQALHYFFMVHILRFLLRIYCFCVHSKGFLHRHQLARVSHSSVPISKHLLRSITIVSLEPFGRVFFYSNRFSSSLLLHFTSDIKYLGKKKNLCSAQDVRSY